MAEDSGIKLKFAGEGAGIEDEMSLEGIRVLETGSLPYSPQEITPIWSYVILALAVGENQGCLKVTGRDFFLTSENNPKIGFLQNRILEKGDSMILKRIWGRKECVTISFI